MESYSVLLDNTTVYGAKSAYETWPHTVHDWFQGANAINIRSLMDFLEALVLYDEIILDSSSRHPDLIIWPEIWEIEKQYRNRPDEKILKNTYFAKARTIISPIVSTALEKLQVYIQDDTFSQDIEQFHQTGLDFIVPEFYTSPSNFSSLLAKSFVHELSDSVYSHLDKVENALMGVNYYVSNYAMFAFRGFYYQELAHLFSISYSPHTWRSRLVENDIERKPVNFAKHIMNVTSSVRQELALKLNSEFGVETFTSEFPVLASYMVHNCTNRKQLIHTAYELRQSSSVRAFRGWIRQVQSSLYDQKNLHQIARAQHDLEVLVKDIRRELGLSTDRNTEELKIKVGIPVASLEVPFTVNRGMPDWLQTILHRKTHLVFLRQIAEKSVSLSPFALRFHQLRP